MQLVTTTSNAILSSHCTNIDKAIMHDVQWERAWNQSQLVVLKAKVEQAKSELVEEKSQMSSYFEEMEKLKLTTRI